MIKILYTRPAAWRKYTSDKVDLVFADVFGPDPRLRKGFPMGDSVGGKVTKDGLQKLFDLFEEHRPDVFFHWSMYGEWSEKAYRRLRQISPKTLFVFGQGNQVLYKKKVDIWLWNYHKHIDVVLTNTTDPVRHKILRKYVPRTGVFYTFGFDPDVHTLSNDAPTFDCFFGGGDTVRDKKHAGKFPYSRFRHDLIMKIDKHHKLLLRGGGQWKRWGLPVKSGLHALEYFKEMQKAKIVLGTYHLDLERYYTKRTVYALASGRLLVTRYIPGMERDGFLQFENVVWYRNMKQAMVYVKHFLDHDDERESISSAGRELAVGRHSWEKRLREIESIVETLVC